MIPSKTILVFLIVFIWFAVILNLFGFLSIEYSEIVSFSLIALGISIYFQSFLEINKMGMFWGPVLFLIGIILLTSSKFELQSTSEYMLPSSFFVLGFSLCLTFTRDANYKKNLGAGMVLVIIGMIILLVNGRFNFSGFIYSFAEIFKVYWIVILISVGTISILVIQTLKSAKRKNDSPDNQNL